MLILEFDLENRNEKQLLERAKQNFIFPIWCNLHCPVDRMSGKTTTASVFWLPDYQKKKKRKTDICITLGYSPYRCLR